MGETKDIMVESRKELVDSVPKVVVYSATAFVIWLFTKVIFIPLGAITFYKEFTAATVIVTIATVAILIILLKILKEIRDVCDALSGLVASTIDPKASSDEYKIYQKVLRSVAYVITVAVIFLFFGSLLSEIHPAITGIILVIIFLWSVGTLYSAGMLLSDKIEARAKRFTARILENPKE